MGYRTLEISSSCEIHIKEGQLEVTSDSGSILILIEDLSQITVHGANIRLSTMDLSILSRNKVSLMTLDEKYLPRRENAHVLQNEVNSNIKSNR